MIVVSVSKVTSNRAVVAMALMGSYVASGVRLDAIYDPMSATILRQPASSFRRAHTLTLLREIELSISIDKTVLSRISPFLVIPESTLGLVDFVAA